MEIGEARRRQLEGYDQVRKYLEKHFSSIGSEVTWKKCGGFKPLGYIVSIDSMLCHFYGLVATLDGLKHALLACGIKVEDDA